jgi:PST family polysaccharide transporter
MRAHTIIEKILPSWIARYVVGGWDKNGFEKYFFNTGWIFVARLVSFTISLLTIAFVARYLGPENYGKLSYAQSFTAIFSVFALLGIDQVLYRDLVAHPEKEKELLGTAFVSRLVFGALSLILAFFTAVATSNDPVLIWLILLITLTFLLYPFSLIANFFSAQVQAKYSSYITIGIAFLIPALKLLLIFFGKGILYFAALITLEALVFGVFHVYVYIRVFRGSLFEWRFSMPIFKSLMYRSWPLMLASLSGYIYGRIDQVMIQRYLDSSAVGVYDVAVRLTEYLGFLPGVLIASLFPAIINARMRDRTEYIKRLKMLTLLCISISVIFAACLFILSPYIIGILFGAKFFASISLLRVYVWSTVGTIAIMLIQNYFIAENKSAHFLFFSILGAGMNVGLNIVLIPMFGTLGAAYATLVTMFLVVLIFLLSQKIKSKHVSM